MIEYQLKSDILSFINKQRLVSAERIKNTCMKRRDQSDRYRSPANESIGDMETCHGHFRISAKTREGTTTEHDGGDLDSVRTSRSQADQTVTQQMVSRHSRKLPTLLFGFMAAIHLTEMSCIREI